MFRTSFVWPFFLFSIIQIGLAGKGYGKAYIFQFCNSVAFRLLYFYDQVKQRRPKGNFIDRQVVFLMVSGLLIQYSAICRFGYFGSSDKFFWGGGSE